MSRLFSVVLLALALMGCDVFRKAKECSSLSQTVSTWMKEMPAPNLAVSETESVARDARATARRYEDLDRRLAALNIEAEELVGPVARYRNIAIGAARVLDEVAQALENDNPELARTRRVEFDDTAKTERALVAEINGICRK